jgi:hypothetical protein
MGPQRVATGENAKLKKLLAAAYLDIHARKSAFGVKRQRHISSARASGK